MLICVSFSVVESILKGENVGITPRRSRSGQVANSVSSSNNSGNGQQVRPFSVVNQFRNGVPEESYYAIGSTLFFVYTSI
jgi:hypothetical protein